MKARKKIENDSRTDLYALYVVCLLFLIGTLFRNQIPWLWLRVTIEFGFFFLLFEHIRLQLKYNKSKKLHPNKDEVK